MAISQVLSGYAFLSDGTPISGATVTLYAAVAGTPSSILQTTSTDANGLWTFTVTTVQQYDVKISWASGAQIRWVKGLSVVGTQVVARQSAAQTIDSATEENTDLACEINASEVWVFHGTLFANPTAAVDIAIDVTVPAAATVIYGVIGHSSGSVSDYQTAAATTGGTDINLGGVDSIIQMIEISGSVANGANAGTIQIRAAEDSAGADFTLNAGSFVIFTRVA